MNKHDNPFEFSDARKFNPEQIKELFVEDHKYLRFIDSKRNIFLLGERGTGKTMALLNYSTKVKLSNVTDPSFMDLDFLSIYVPCNTTLTHKREVDLLPDYPKELVSEHYFVSSIILSILQALRSINVYIEPSVKEDVFSYVTYLFDASLLEERPLFEALYLWIEKRLASVQKDLNSYKDFSSFDLFSFSSTLIPLIECIKRIPLLKNTHFSLMIDDAQYLNHYQNLTLNSWIAYRDTTIFSFKVATTKVDQPTNRTSSGGTILEGHDFVKIDLERPYQNRDSEYGKHVKKIIEQRFEKYSIKKSPEEFFPESPEFAKGMNEAEEITVKKAKEKYPDGTQKQIADYVYKYHRAEYFKKIAISKANRPHYSGFEMLTHLSTGVIRNFLEPCYWMYDKALSESDKPVCSIPPKIQNEVIENLSIRTWNSLKELDKNIDRCSFRQCEMIYSLFDRLAIHFRERLISDSSEPRAIKFMITEKTHENHKDLLDLLEIARKAQLLYINDGPGKDDGRKVEYYVPNRMLWPSRGLDPCGQASTVSLTTTVLWDAANKGKRIPLSKNKNVEDKQMRLFGNE